MASFRGGMEFVGGRAVKLAAPRGRMAAAPIEVSCADRPVVAQGQAVAAGQRLCEPADASLPCVIAPLAGTVAAVRETGAAFDIRIEPSESEAPTALPIEPPHHERLVDWYDAMRHTGPWALDGLDIGLVAQLERAKQRPPEQLLCIGADRFPPFADRSSLMIGFADDAVLGLKVLGDVVGAKRSTMLVGRTARVVARIRKSCRNFSVQLGTLDNVYPNAHPTMAAWLFSHGRKRLPHGADPMDHGLMLITPWTAIRVGRWLTRRVLDVVQPLMVGRVGVSTGEAQPGPAWTKMW